MEKKESRYHTLLLDRVDEIRKICNTHQIPCFLAFGAGEQDGRYQMRGFCLLPELFGEHPKDRRFSDFVNIQNGFLVKDGRTVPPETEELEEIAPAFSIESE